jgi:hypothetical protein
MPRVGMNPARGHKTDYIPARVTVAVLTHLPDTAGYFRERFDVTRLCINSIIANTSIPYDLMVVDNGSCSMLVDFLCDLHEKGFIGYLLLSRENIGKIGALQMLTRAAPGEIIAYTDDDIYFMPGWLEAHLKLIDTYPKVGMVTGLYIRSRVLDATKSTFKFAQEPGVEMKKGYLIPREWEEEYIQNSNRTWERYQTEIKDLDDVVLSFNGVDAWVSAHHFQFVAPRKALLQALPGEWSGNLMGQMLDLENALDAQGYLRLCTRQQTVHLLGNSLSPQMQLEARALGIELSTIKFNQSSGRLKGLAKIPGIRGLAYAIYNRLYDFLNV